MRCPYCSTCDSQVKDSRPSDDDATIRRRRVCNACGARFTTFERIQLRELSVRKTNGQVEAFNRDKVERSIRLACRKRDVTESQIDKIVTSIQRRLETDAGDDFITSESIGDMVSESLLMLDPIAFVRFVSVYKKFQRVADFKKIIAQIPEADEGADICELPRRKVGGQRGLF